MPAEATLPAEVRGASLAVPTRDNCILADLARRHPALPRDAVADFMTGMRQDLAGPQIATDGDLDVYCYRVAGTVGRLMAAILGGEGPEADTAARSLGSAMQRTNIIRDVDEDLANGRIYLPADALARHGITPPPSRPPTGVRSWPRRSPGPTPPTRQASRGSRASDTGVARSGPLPSCTGRSSGRWSATASAPGARTARSYRGARKAWLVLRSLAGGA